MTDLPDPNRAVMGPEYFKDKEQLTWREGANQLWEAEHGIDPRTGDITGPAGPIPGGIGLKWQAVHDQMVWRARNRMAQDALRYAQGATGLMSSYRAGGGAAIQSNVYGNLANVQMNRAQMMQPMDLLGDYRRDQLARAGRSGRSESTIGMALQGLGAVLSVVPGLNVVGAALAVGGGALAGSGNARQAASIARAQGGGSTYGGGGGANGGFNMQGVQQLGQAVGQQFAGSGSQAIGGPSNAELNNMVGQPGAFGPGQAAGSGPSVAPAPGIAGSTGPGTFFAESQGQGQAQGQAMQPQGGQQSGGMSGGMKQMGPPPVVGADGRFDPLAYAQHGAMTAMAPQHMQLALSENLASHIQDDPSWSILTMAFDSELAARTIARGQE